MARAHCACKCDSVWMTVFFLTLVCLVLTIPCISFLQDNPPYDKGAFRIEIIFPTEYPFKPPKITFKTKIYHPNIDEKGQVCLPVISAENWKPATKTDQGRFLFVWVLLSFYVLSASRIDIYSTELCIIFKYRKVITLNDSFIKNVLIKPTIAFQLKVKISKFKSVIQLNTADSHLILGGY